MKKAIVLSSFALIGIGLGCGSNNQQVQETQVDSLQLQAKSIFAALPTVAEDSLNPISEQKVLLGRTLYFDKRLSKGNTQSCNSCHNLATFGVDHQPTSKGELGKNGNRNSPTVFNAALHISQFWDGRAANVEEQAGGPILNPVEMNAPSGKFLEERLKKIKGYKELFAQAFPKDKDPIQFENLKKAIGAFERTLLTPSKFDKYLQGDIHALSTEEKAGLNTFINTGCIACHGGVTIGGNMLQKFPLIGNDYMSLTGSKREDKGKMEVTKNESDKFFFKVPSLRNITETSPYLHDGSVNDLEQLIKIMGKAQLGKDLNDSDVASIKLFLGTLKGEIALEKIKEPSMPM